MIFIKATKNEGYHIHKTKNTSIAKNRVLTRKRITLEGPLWQFHIKRTIMIL